MIHENSEITGRGAKPPQPDPAPEAGPEAGPELKIDLERLVWDPEYREIMRARMKPLG